MTLTLRHLLLSALLLSGSMAAANSYREMTLEERVANSELVIVADFIAPAGCPENSERWCGDGGFMATYRVRDSLKGKVQNDEIVIQCRSNVAEGSPGACDSGRYLLFLKRSNAGHWIVVNGPYGALKICGTDRAECGGDSE